MKKLLLLQCFYVVALAAAMPIDKLVPPRLDSDTMACSGFCDRPKRMGGPQVSISYPYALSTTPQRTVVHCYGHGGSGFVTLFGVVEEAIGLLMHTHPAYTDSVVVIGSGCVGLTMAIELRRRGFTKVHIVTKERYNLPSWRAGGFFDPGTGTETTPLGQQACARGVATFHVYHQAEQGLHPYLGKETVRRMPLYCCEQMDAGVEILEQLGYMPPREQVQIDFGAVTHDHYVKYMTYFMDVAAIMQQLWNEVERLQIPVTIESVEDINFRDERIVCNCAGLEGGKLNSDQGVYAQRGHFFLLTPDSGTEHMEYMLFTKVKQGDTYEYMYLFPKDRQCTAEHPEGIPCHGMLGGTFVSHADKLDPQEQEALNAREWQKIAERTHEFFYGKHI